MVRGIDGGSPEILYSGASMKLTKPDELQTILNRGELGRAAGIFQQLDPAVAADSFLGMPWEQQQVLFRDAVLATDLMNMQIAGLDRAAHRLGAQL